MLKKVITSALIGLFIAILFILFIKKGYIVLDPYNNVISYNSAIEKSTDSVVNIGITKNDNNIKNLGSGLIMTSDGYILTNYHVISVDQSLHTSLIVEHHNIIYSAKIIGFDKLTDLAVLKIEPKPEIKIKKIPFNPKVNIQVGDVVLAIGNPFNLGKSVTQGIVSGVGRTNVGNIGRQTFIQTDAAINEGNSGGALINTSGYVIGINTSHLIEHNAQGVGFALPINFAYDIMQKIIKNGRVIRSYLGVASYYNNNGSARITDIIAGGPADKAGLKIGDIVEKINGNNLLDDDDLLKIIANTPPNTKIELQVLRDGVNQISIPVMTENYPEQ